MSNNRVRNCQFAFKCDKQWDQLMRTSSERVRYCTDCARDVFYCSTDSEIAEAVRLNRCVAVETLTERTENRREESEMQIHTVGIVNPAVDE